MDDTIDIDADRFITVVYERRWPKNVASWSVRQRSGDSDYPLARGEVDAVLKPEHDASAVWTSVREQALFQANAAALSFVPAEEKRPSFFQKLLGRK
ncbi:MAG: hypothetical protein NVSMB52_08840 [Chloroflexota bacterium]